MKENKKKLKKEKRMKACKKQMTLIKILLMRRSIKGMKVRAGLTMTIIMIVSKSVRKMKEMMGRKVQKKKRKVTMRMKIEMLGAAQSFLKTLVTAVISWYPMYQLSPRKMTVIPAGDLCHGGRQFWPASSAAALINAASAFPRKTRRKNFKD